MEKGVGLHEMTLFIDSHRFHGSIEIVHIEVFIRLRQFGLNFLCQSKRLQRTRGRQLN